MEQSSMIERDCALGGLFQQIINEMKNTTPLWEDLAGKSTKLHACLRSTIQAVTAFLDAFQKIADAATSTKGATKDIGTALTRICLRHKAIEVKMKTFTSSIMDCLILPLQERLEEWKKTTVILDKDHAKEYKRSRAELKKRSIETLRLQKKLRKGGLNNGGMSGSFSGTLPRSGGGMGSGMGSSGESLGLQGGANRDLNRILEVALRDTAEKRQAFEDSEKQAIRNALVEERSRFCLFVSYLKPVVDEEVGMLYELQHVQEAMIQLEKHSIDPFSLPPASEQVITDLKGSCDSGAWSFQTPPSSPSSLGSRKSSMCSISSANSSSSGSAHSPSHNVHHRTIHHPPMVCHPTGTLRYSSVSSQDSGFMSQDALFSRMPTPFFDHRKGGNQSEGSNTSSTASSNSSTPSSPYPPGSIPTTNATWPNVQDSIQFERAACAIMNERPHTISSSYERGHQRPPLTVYTFQPPADSSSHPVSPTSTPVVTPIVEPQSHTMQGVYQSASEIYGILRGKTDAKPPVPKRGSSLERPQLTSGSSSTNNSISGNGTPKPLPKNSKGSKDLKKDQAQMNNKVVPNLPDFNQSSDDMIVPQPVYVNMHELNQMASAKLQRQAELDLPPPPPELMTPPTTKVDGLELSNLKSEGSLASSGYGSQNQIVMCEDSNSGGSGSSTLEDLNYPAPPAEICYCLDLSSGYCTLPRNMRHFGKCCYARGRSSTRTRPSQGYPLGRQPTSGSGSSAGSAAGSRRNSCGNQEKPPPPVRRNSSISVSPSRNSPAPLSPHHSNMNGQFSLHQHQQQPIYYQPQPQTQIQNSSPPSAQSHYQHQHHHPNQNQNHQASNNSQPLYIQNANYNYNNSTNNSNSLSSSQGSMDSGETTPHASMEHLPPPPAYLMGLTSEQRNSVNAAAAAAAAAAANSGMDEEALKRVSVADTIKCLTEKNHQPVSPNMVRRAHSLRAPGEENSHGKEKESRRRGSNSLESSKNRASLMQVLNQKLAQHQPTYGNLGQPLSSSVVASTQQHLQQQIPAQIQPIYQQHQHQQQTVVQHQQHKQNVQQQPIYQQVYQNPTQPIYQQVVATSNNSTNASPRHPRRFSEELIKTTATFVQNRVLGNKTPPPAVTSKEIFVQTLNAKLSQMRQSPPTERKPPQTQKNNSSFASKLAASVSSHQKGNSVGEISAAFRVRQWISSKTVADPAVCRESLMDQIRRGTKLKQTRTVNDRSAPRIH